MKRGAAVFHGWVSEIEGDQFTATVGSVTDGDTIAGYAIDMKIADLAAAERRYLQVGAYVTIKLAKDELRVRFSRRRWTQRALDQASRKAARLEKVLK